MNGRAAKKARKMAEVNVYKTYVGFVRSIMGLPLKKRLRFCYSVLFRKAYEG